MKKFPTLCIDNFYDDPNSVREFALQQSYDKDPEGRWPGKRTDLLDKINKPLFDDFCKKLFSYYFDYSRTSITWQVYTGFQLIDRLSDDPNSMKNHGWIHKDKETVLAGIIYLTPEIETNCGTSLHELVDESKLCKDKTKQMYYKDGIDKNYDQVLKDHNSCFKEKRRFENVYNRLVAYDASEYHKADSYFTKENPRLTQVFFVHEINVTYQSYLD